MSDIPETANKGLEGVVACTSEISTIHDVTLLYRGYTIESLVEQCCFEEIIHLLWYKELPNKKKLEELKTHLSVHMPLPPALTPILKSIAGTKAHSMAKLRTAISYFALLDHKAEDNSDAGVKQAAIRLTAALGPMIAALSRLEQGKEIIAPTAGKSVAWNFLNMMHGKGPSKEEEDLFDTALVLHADHELNASTFTARVVASTTSDYYSDIVGAIGSLKGPLHGGANEQVMIMLQQINTLQKVDPFIKDAVDNKKKVMGIGHRVYKNGDPRAKILRDMSLKICEKAGLEEQHKILSRIEQQMLDQKGLMPNVDFYSGLVYTALGLRPRDFTPIFALSRNVGWSAQILEQTGNNRIYRPRAYYTGPVDLTITPMDQRK